MVSLVQSSYETLHPTKSPLAKTGATHMSKKILHGIACSCLVLFRIIFFPKSLQQRVNSTRPATRVVSSFEMSESQEGSWDTALFWRNPLYIHSIHIYCSHEPYPQTQIRDSPWVSAIQRSQLAQGIRIQELKRFQTCPTGYSAYCHRATVDQMLWRRPICMILIDFAWQRRSQICTERKYVYDEDIFNVYDSRMRRSAQVVVQNMQKKN